MQNLGPIWTEIDLDAIVSNIKAIKELVGRKVKIMGVVKANAYGHDALEVAPLYTTEWRILLSCGSAG